MGFTRRVRQGHGNIVPREKDQGAEKKAGVDLKMAPLNAVNLIIGPETLLVIDDVERCDMGIRELLGAVDQLVVGCRKKVLLVCNEDEWRERARTEGGEGDDQGVREPHREDRLAEVPVQALGRLGCGTRSGRRAGRHLPRRARGRRFGD